MDKTILHCDLNGFYASVECVLNPSLKDKPIAVAGNPKNRHGIILAKNEAAKKYNIQTAETLWQAKKKCPEIIFVKPKMEEYKKYSRLVNEIYNSFTDLVEPYGIDESWLDVTGVYMLFGDGVAIADKIRKKVRTELGLTVSVGVSFNKAFAKLGSDYKKPDATTVITRDNFRKIVWELPVSDLLYAGRKSTKILNEHNIYTIKDLALADSKILNMLLGKQGDLLKTYAIGEDKSPVSPFDSQRDLKSIGNGITFKKDLKNLDDLYKGTAYIADTVSFRLRKHEVKCFVVSVTLKDNFFKSVSKQKKLDNPINSTKELIEISYMLVKSFYKEGTFIRSLTISTTDFVFEEDAVIQMSFFNIDECIKNEKFEKLDKVSDKLYSKYGKNVLSLGFNKNFYDES